MLCTGGWDRTLRLYSTDPDPEDLQTGSAEGAANSKKRRTAAGFDEQTLTVRHGFWLRLCELEPRSTQQFSPLAFWGTAYLWQRPLATLEGSTAAVTCLVWPERGTLYSGGEDHCIHVWDVAAGQMLQTLVCGEGKFEC